MLLEASYHPLDIRFLEETPPLHPSCFTKGKTRGKKEGEY
jgi:hypothetical protein